MITPFLFFSDGCPFADAFQAYQAATGAEADPDIGLLRLTPAQYSNLESLFFKIGDVSVFSIPLLCYAPLLTTFITGHLRAHPQCTSLASYGMYHVLV